MKTGNVKLMIAFSVFFVAVSTVIALTIGTANISIADVISALFGFANETDTIIVRQLRLPRIIAAILVGANLALAGCGLQSIFRNPLAEPSITGVSAGASLGAVVAIMFLPCNFAIETLSFLFALIASVAVCYTGRENGKVNPTSTVLAGVAINAICAAGVGLFMYTARESGLKSFVFWSLGSFDKCSWQAIALSASISIPAWLIMLSQYKNLNVMLLGDRQAFDVGVNVRKTQILVVLSAVAMTSASVAMCGTIAFVGLMIPHIARIVCGAGNGKVMPISILLGAGLCVCADMISRYVSAENPVPIGVITSILGAPFFIFIIRKGKGNA